MVGSDDTNNLQYERNLRPFYVLLNQRWFIIVFCCSAILFSLLLTYVFSEKYMAQTVLLYQPVESSLLRPKTTESFGAPVPIAPFKVIMQTLRDMVKTESVLRPVVEKLGLDKEVNKEYNSWYSSLYHKSKDLVKDGASNLWCILKHGRVTREDPTISAMKGLARSIEIVSSPRESYIYVLRVKDKYPKRAAAIVDEVSQTLVQLLKDEQQALAKGKMQHLQEELKKQDDEILVLRQKRKEIIESNNLVSVSDQTSRGLANLYELQLKQVLLDAQISKRRREIEAYNKNITDQKVAQSEDIKKMRSQKLFSEVSLEGLIVESEFTKKTIKELKADLDKMPLLQQQIDVFDNRIVSAVREYEILKDFHTEILAQVKTVQSETRLLAKAFVPSIPIQPIKIYHVGLTGILGLIFSVGFVYILDFLGVRGEAAGSFPVSAKSSKLLMQSGGMTDFLLEELADKVAAQGGSLFLREKEKLVLTKSLDMDHVPKVIDLPLIQGSIFAQVMETGEPMLVQDIQNRDDLKSSGWDGYKDDSFMVLPVPGESGETVGVISLHNKTKPPFVNEDKNTSFELLTSRSIKAKPMGIFARILRYLPIIFITAALAAFTFYILRRVGF